MPNSFRHLNINKEILKQVQDDALAGGYNKIQETYKKLSRFHKNNSLGDIQLPIIQSTMLVNGSEGFEHLWFVIRFYWAKGF